MSDREPWERNDNPEPWTRPDKAAPWLSKKKENDPWDRQKNTADHPESQAIQSFRNSENSATSGREPSYYRGNGGKIQNNMGAQPKIKGKKKGLGAIITIAIILAAGGTFLGASNSLLAPALSALITESTQTNYTSYVLRTKYLTKNMMQGVGADAVNTKWTGQVKYSRIPNYMKKRLAKYGIEVTGSGSSTKLHWNNMDIDADQFIDLYNTNVEFRDAYSKAKRGRVATFFDNAAEKFYRKLGLSRNVQANFKTTGDPEVDSKNYNDLLKKEFEGSRSTVRTNTKREEPIYDEEGKPVTDKNGNQLTEIVDETNSTSSVAGSDGSDVDASKSSAKSFIASAAGAIADIGSVGCALAKITSMIAVTVAANEIYQSITFFQTSMENPSKMMAGYGAESGINVFLNQMTAAAPSSVTDFNAITIDTATQTNSAGDNPPEQVENKAPLESPALQNLMANAPLSASSLSNYSLERAIKKLGGSIAFGAGATTVCNAIDAASSIISISSVFLGGVPSFLGNFITKTIGSFAISTIASAFLGFLVPTIARSLFSNVYETATGVAFGNLIAQGAYAANSRNGLSESAQAPSGASASAEFQRNTNTVLALEAEQDRYNHSPFDINNHNTFFGSVAYSLLPTITSTNMTGLASFIRSTTTSLSTLLSKVSAEGEGDSYSTTYGDCPILNSIDVEGDVFCNPIVTTDMSTIELPPDDTDYSTVIADSMESCDEEGDCVIDDDSNLAHYITYCAGRTSPFGIVDQNILGAFEVGDTTLNSIPLVGDVLGLINAGIDEANIPWATGQICTDTDSNSDFWDSEGKYYQRYIEDQRILEQMGAYEDSENPVTAYKERYAAKHPTDDSYIGYLSQISGLTRDNTVTMLAAIVYYDFVDQYDPTLRIAMQDGDTTKPKSGEEVVASIIDQQLLFSDNDLVHNPVETNSPAREHIIYFDLRNRSYVA